MKSVPFLVTCLYPFYSCIFSSLPVTFSLHSFPSLCSVRISVNPWCLSRRRLRFLLHGAEDLLQSKWLFTVIWHWTIASPPWPHCHLIPHLETNGICYLQAHYILSYDLVTLKFRIGSNHRCWLETIRLDAHTDCDKALSVRSVWNREEGTGWLTASDSIMYAPLLSCTSQNTQAATSVPVMLWLGLYEAHGNVLVTESARMRLVSGAKCREKSWMGKDTRHPVSS